jgi:hypothetical protein
VNVPPPAIGDACASALDCDLIDETVCDQEEPTEDGYCTVTGCKEGTCPKADRVCDQTLTEDGYCTMIGCEPGKCPEDAVCVRFDPGDSSEPLERCMASCHNDSDCRDGLGCLDAGQLAGTAESLDGEAARFCTVVPK